MILLNTDIGKKVLNAVRDAIRELEGLEESHDWYCASPKLMAKLEYAETELAKVVPKG